MPLRVIYSAREKIGSQAARDKRCEDNWSHATDFFPRSYWLPPGTHDPVRLLGLIKNVRPGRLGKGLLSFPNRVRIFLNVESDAHCDDQAIFGSSPQVASYRIAQSSIHLA